MNRLCMLAAGVWLLMELTGCKDKDEPLPLPEEQDLAIQNYLAENEIDSATKSDQDFYYFPVVEGNSLPNSSNIISFYYTVKNMDGVVVASYTAGNGEPIKAQRNTKTIYPPGLDEALQILATGDSYVFIFPSHKAYGALEVSGDLPANSIAIIEIEVVAEESINQIRQKELQLINNYISDFEISNNPDTVINLISGLSIIKTKRDKQAVEVPSSGTIAINWTGKFFSGDSFGSESGFEVNMGADEVITGLEAGLNNMRLGEEAQLLIPSEMAYGASVQTVPHSAGFQDILIEKQIIPDYGAVIPPYTPLIVVVTVVEYQ